MKSSSTQLEKRGYVEVDLTVYEQLEVEKLYLQLQSKKAFERTIAVRVLASKVGCNDKKYVASLLELLATEKALYTKIEICHQLEQGNENTCKKMIQYLGKIGNNQHRILPTVVSKKISYPLPRDIIARTLGEMNPENIDVLLEVLETQEETKIAEVLDAIGLMVFYHPKLSTIRHFSSIRTVIEKYKEKELIVWKGVECLSAFKLEENKQYLEKLKQTVVQPTILLEIQRSLTLINANT